MTSVSHKLSCITPVYRRPLIYLPVSLLRVQYQDLTPDVGRLQAVSRWFKHRRSARVIHHWLPGPQKRYYHDSVFAVYIHSPNLSYRIRTYSHAHKNSHVQAMRMYCAPSSCTSLWYSRRCERQRLREEAFLLSLKKSPQETRRELWIQHVMQSHGDLIGIHYVNAFGQMTAGWYYKPHYPSRSLIKQYFAIDIT